MQARYYDPVIGRFYGNDPFGFSNVHNFNRYAYVNNNPYKYTDPNGEFILGAVISLAIEVAVQAVEVSKGGKWNITKMAISAVAGGVGVGLGQKAVQLGSLLSNGSKAIATVSEITGSVTEAVATNIVETSANNIVNSITEDTPVSDPEVKSSSINAVVNTAVGNVVDNKIGVSGTNKSKIIAGVVEGARKIINEVLE